MVKKTRYPSFNVMDEREEWDAHTQAIVTNRLMEPQTCTELGQVELQLLRQICSTLVDDKRDDVISHILAHVDQSLKGTTGEGERKSGLPQLKKLILDGIQYISVDILPVTEISASPNHEEDLCELLQQVSEGKAAISKWSSELQREWFVKLLSLTVEAYCSHPQVWSEMGYAGPAYPRGYVRGDIGRLDPWEANEEA